MWIAIVSLTTLWMAGVIRGQGGFWHLIALAALMLILIEGTTLERRLVRVVLRRR